MQLLITCGPTYEPLDCVRRLTNFSTGKLGIELANYFVNHGQEPIVLRGVASTYSGPCHAKVRDFTTTANLLERLREVSDVKFSAVFHAAAVSDFRFGQVFRRSPEGNLDPVISGKFSTRDGTLLAELLPTPKIIHELRGLFPAARVCGWKYEVEGDADSAIAMGVRQVKECQTEFCVVNGPAYGEGFGLTAGTGLIEHCATSAELYSALHRRVTAA